MADKSESFEKLSDEQLESASGGFIDEAGYIKAGTKGALVTDKTKADLVGMKTDAPIRKPNIIGKAGTDKTKDTIRVKESIRVLKEK